METLDQNLLNFTKYLFKFFSGREAKSYFEVREDVRKKFTTYGYRYNQEGVYFESVGAGPNSIKYLFAKYSELKYKLLNTEEALQIMESLSPKQSVLFKNHIVTGLISSFTDLLNRKREFDEKWVYETLVKDLNGSDVICKSSIYLQGLALDSNSFSISENIILRRAEPKDFENIIGFENVGDITSCNISACIDILISVPPNDVYKRVDSEVKRILTLLTLATSGSVRYAFEFQKYESFAHGYFFGRKGLTDINWYGFYTHFVSQHDELKMQSLFSSVTIPTFLYSLDSKDVNAVTIAYEHYIESVLNRGSLLKRVASIVMGFEALLSNDTMELKFRLTNRIARLYFAVEEPNPLELRKILKYSYDFRSKYAHGTNLEAKEINKITELYGSEKSYLKRLNRILGNLIILFIKPGINKKDLIELIDDSLLIKIQKTNYLNF